jgi:RNA polymerase sigma factor (sigma-70 family)
MAVSRASPAVHTIRTLVQSHDARSASDASLVLRYVQTRDETAFEMLVRRHGPLVMRICRSVLRNEQDAEDAFQATFLVLFRRAASIQAPDRLVNWLYGVARRTALEARDAVARRQSKEQSHAVFKDLSSDARSELWEVVNQELGCLSDRDRAVIIVCDIEGKTRREAARQLDWPEGTVATRLARARRLLAKRLARRGFGASLAAAGMMGQVASAHLSERLVQVSLQATASIVASHSSTGVSSTVLKLSERVLKSMTLFSPHRVFAAALLVSLTGLGAGLLLSTAPANETDGQPPAKQESRPRKQEDVHQRVSDLKQQFQQLQRTIDSLERDLQPSKKERPLGELSLGAIFKHKVDFELGQTEFTEGGRVEILEVLGTRPKVEQGGQYAVRGRYVLPKGQRGKLYLYATAGGDWGNAHLATLDSQMLEVDQVEGEFILVHGMYGPGYFHIVLADPNKYSRMFANVYFGTGDSVWRQ